MGMLTVFIVSAIVIAILYYVLIQRRMGQETPRDRQIREERQRELHEQT